MNPKAVTAAVSPENHGRGRVWTDYSLWHGDCRDRRRTPRFGRSLGARRPGMDGRCRVRKFL